MLQTGLVSTFLMWFHLPDKLPCAHLEEGPSMCVNERQKFRTGAQEQQRRLTECIPGHPQWVPALRATQGQFFLRSVAASKDGDTGQVQSHLFEASS